LLSTAAPRARPLAWPAARGEKSTTGLTASLCLLVESFHLPPL